MRVAIVAMVSSAYGMCGSMRLAIHPASAQPSARIARAEQRVVDRAEAHADDEHDAQIERVRDIGLRERVRKRREPAACAFDEDAVRLRVDARVRGDDRVERHGFLCEPRGDVRCDRGRVGERIAVGVGGRGIARRDQRERVLVAQALRRVLAAAGDGLHAARAQAVRAPRGEQRAARECLADAGVGAGDEDAFTPHRSQRVRGVRATRPSARAE
jgi:hypothetical protein